MRPNVVHHPREEKVAGTFITDYHLADKGISISLIRVDSVHHKTSMIAVARIERNLGRTTFKGMTVIVTTRHLIVKYSEAKDMIGGTGFHLAANVMIMVGEVAHGVSRLVIVVTTASGESIQKNDTAMRDLIGMMCPNVRDMTMTLDAVQDDTVATTRIVEMAEGNVLIATDMVTTIKIDKRIASTIVIAAMETIRDRMKESTAMITSTGNESIRKVIDVVAVEAGVTKINNNRSKVLGGKKKVDCASLWRSNL
jgi:hypothetical protein